MSRRPPWVLGARSETGYVRSVNEDRMGWVRASFGDIFVVCDGMGGQGGGDIAAQIAIDELQRRLAAIPPTTPRFTDHVRDAFSAANKEVHARRRPDDPATRAMGTTGVALITDGKRFIAAHVGDSRIYLWRGGLLQQLTRDHSHVQAMMDEGLLTQEQAATHPDASLLTRAIGHQPAVQADVTDWIALEPGDELLLCSDGLSGYVADAQIAAILAASHEPQVTTDALVKAALDTGGHDNVTVQIVRFSPSLRGAIRRSLGRPLVLVPTCVAVAVAAMGSWDWYRAHEYRDQIASLEGRLAQAQAQAQAQTQGPALANARQQSTAPAAAATTLSTTQPASTSPANPPPPGASAGSTMRSPPAPAPPPAATTHSRTPNPHATSAAQHTTTSSARTNAATSSTAVKPVHKSDATQEGDRAPTKPGDPNQGTVSGAATNSTATETSALGNSVVGGSASPAQAPAVSATTGGTTSVVTPPAPAPVPAPSPAPAPAGQAAPTPLPAAAPAVAPAPVAAPAPAPAATPVPAPAPSPAPNPNSTSNPIPVSSTTSVASIREITDAGAPVPDTSQLGMNPAPGRGIISIS